MSAPAGQGTTAMHVRGHVLPDGHLRDIWVVDRRITFRKAPRAVTLARDGWVLPGLVDAHAHLGLHSPVVGTPRDRAVASALAHRDAGVLAVREPGAADHVSVTLDADDLLPRIVTGGRFLAPPGGYLPGLAREVGAADLPTAATEEALVSGAWATVIGDFVQDGRASVPHWDLDTLRRTADAVHGVHGRVTIHATDPEVIEAAVLAGFDAIEHGTGLRPDQIDLLVAHGTAWVPTLVMGQDLRQAIEHRAGDAVAATVTGWLDRLPGVVARAVQAGVDVFAGTDAGMGTHGRVAAEVACLVDAGVDPHDAMGAASWRARTWLGLPGVEEGAPADLVIYRDDPRADPTVLWHPTAVVLDGRPLGLTHVATGPHVM